LEATWVRSITVFLLRQKVSEITSWVHPQVLLGCLNCTPSLNIFRPPQPLHSKLPTKSKTMTMTTKMITVSRFPWVVNPTSLLAQRRSSSTAEKSNPWTNLLIPRNLKVKKEEEEEKRSCRRRAPTAGWHDRTLLIDGKRKNNNYNNKNNLRVTTKRNLVCCRRVLLRRVVQRGGGWRIFCFSEVPLKGEVRARTRWRSTIRRMVQRKLKGRRVSDPRIRREERDTFRHMSCTMPWREQSQRIWRRELSYLTDKGFSEDWLVLESSCLVITTMIKFLKLFVKKNVVFFCWNCIMRYKWV